MGIALKRKQRFKLAWREHCEIGSGVDSSPSFPIHAGALCHGNWSNRRAGNAPLLTLAPLLTTGFGAASRCAIWGQPIRFQRSPVTRWLRSRNIRLDRVRRAGSGRQRGSPLPPPWPIFATKVSLLHGLASKVGRDTFEAAPNPEEASCRFGKPAGTRTNSNAAPTQREAPNRRLVDLNYISPSEAPDVHSRS